LKRIRKISILVLIIILISGIFAGTDQPVLILVHPHSYHLKTFDYLLNNKIIDIPGLQIIAVYYDKTDYDVNQTNRFIENNNYTHIKTKLLEGELSPENLYQENELTADFKALFQKSDGIIFLGGADIPPEVYGSKTNLLTNISTPYRHYFEISFLFHLLGSHRNDAYTPLLEKKSDYTIIGFCLGMQTMNVATGGTMYQDIPSEIYNIKFVEDVLALPSDQQHRNYNISFSLDNSLTWGHLHKIKLQGELFSKMLGKNLKSQPYIYSSHHQAVKKLGQGFQISASSMDGRVIEAIAHTKYPHVFGVQFHPEVLDIYKGSKDYKITPESEPVSLRKLIKEKESHGFHLKFWGFFSENMK